MMPFFRYVALAACLFACGSPDEDGDGYTADVDCDDANPAIHPGAEERCDEVDNNCDGDVDSDAVDRLTSYPDSDTDGYGAMNQPELSCAPIPQNVDNDQDCDDSNGDIHPEAEEVYYDDVDQNCDGLSDFDADEDGYDSVDYSGEDCDDTLDTVHPGAEEICDGKDTDCDGKFETQTLVFDPEEGRDDVRLQARLKASFQHAEAGASVVLATDGAAVNGSSGWEGSTLVFTPETVLQPKTDYVATWEHMCGPSTLSFRTGDHKPPVLPSSLLGRVYHTDPEDADWTKPASIGELVKAYWHDTFLLEVIAANETEIQFLGALAEKGSTDTQKTCAIAAPLEPADFSWNPFVDWGPKDTSFNAVADGLADDTAFILENLRITGEFAADGSEINSVGMTGLLDTRSLVHLLGDDSAEDDAICVLAATLGVSCVACADAKDFCLDFALDNMVLAEVDGDLVADPDPCSRSECDDICEDGIPPGCRCDSTSGAAGTVWLFTALLGLIRRRGR